MYGDQTNMVNPVSDGRSFDTPQVAGALVIGALVFLILVKRGFRGVSAGGAGVRIG
jgi:hypothetical protein